MVLRGGVKRWPRASIVHGSASSSSNSMGVMRRMRPSLHVDEDGPAVGVAGVAAHAAAHVDAELETRGQHHLERLREPDGQLVRALDAHLEVLERVDELEVVAARPHDGGRDLRGVEAHGEVRRRVQPGARAHLAAADGVGAPAAPAGQADLRHQVALAQARGERRVAPRRRAQRDLEPRQRRRELRLGRRAPGLPRHSRRHPAPVLACHASLRVRGRHPAASRSAKRNDHST